MISRDLSWVLAGTPTCSPAMCPGLPYNMVGWVQSRAGDREREKEKKREGSPITFYDLAVEATHFVYQGSHKGLLSFTERGNELHLLWEISKVVEDHVGPEIFLWLFFNSTYGKIVIFGAGMSQDRITAGFD